jgi:hypothetical protein
MQPGTKEQRATNQRKETVEKTEALKALVLAVLLQGAL